MKASETDILSGVDKQTALRTAREGEKSDRETVEWDGG